MYILLAFIFLIWSNEITMQNTTKSFFEGCFMDASSFVEMQLWKVESWFTALILVYLKMHRLHGKV